MENVKGFKIGMLNVRSLWPHFDEVNTILGALIYLYL